MGELGRRAGAVALAALLGACGGGVGDASGTAQRGTGDAPPATASGDGIDHLLAWQVATDESAGDHDVTVHPVALDRRRPTSDFDVATVDEVLCSHVGTDGSSYSTPGLDALNPVPDWTRGLRTVPAGEVLVLSTPFGTLGELAPVDGDAGPFYAWTAPVAAGPLPPGIVLDVPGEAFPAVADAALPTQAPIGPVRFEQASTDVAPDALAATTTVRWNPSAGSVASLSASDPYAGGFVACVMPDTGRFAFPDAVRARLGADFVATRARLVRIDRDDERRGTVLVRTQRVTARALVAEAHDGR